MNFQKVFYIPPVQVKKSNIEMTELDGFSRDPSEAKLSKFLAHNAGDMNLMIPEPLTRRILKYTAAIVGIYALVTKIIPWLMTIYKTPIFWLVICLGGYAFSMAGTVFNAISGAEWNYSDQNGNIYYIYPQQGQQFIAEGIIMSALLTCCASLFISLGVFVPKYKGAWIKRAIFVVLALGFYWVFDKTFTIFKMKYGFYPFWNA